MSTTFAKHVAVNKAPKIAPLGLTTKLSAPIPGRAKDMVSNSSGAMVFKINSLAAVQRFLVLGTEGGTGYVSERDLTKIATTNLRKAIKEGAREVVDLIVEISASGRAPKNDYALFALALVMAEAQTAEDKYYARTKLNQVARTGTHLLHFAEFVNGLKGWGTGTRKAFQNWFLSKSPEQIGYQAIKYMQRDGWSQRDLLRKAHPFGTPEQNVMFKFIAKKGDIKRLDLADILALPPQVKAAVEAKSEGCSPKKIVSLIETHKLPWEAIPTEHLNNTAVWNALIPSIGITALLRNLGRMTAIGVIGNNDITKYIAGTLTNEETIRKGRLHPLAVLNALRTYKNGKGVKGSLSWAPHPLISDALEQCFQKSFGLVEPSGKNRLLAIDCSASMTWGKVAGTQFNYREAAAAMALISAKVEKAAKILGFSDKLVDLGITTSDTFNSAVSKISKVRAGSTRCSLPMETAIANRWNIDQFEIYTDNETNKGGHPSLVLKDYRAKFNKPNAKMAVIAMSSTGFSIADPKDPYMLDFVGFDLATPQMLSEFARMD